MPPKAPIDWHSPLSCPRCETESGHPFYVQSKGSKEVIVRVRCGACAHEWLIERETPTFMPGADRSATGDENTD